MTKYSVDLKAYGKAEVWANNWTDAVRKAKSALSIHVPLVALLSIAQVKKVGGRGGGRYKWGGI